jgi:hypothetical protein
LTLSYTNSKIINAGSQWLLIDKSPAIPMPFFTKKLITNEKDVYPFVYAVTVLWGFRPKWLP